MPWSPPAVHPQLANLPCLSLAPIMHQWGPLAWPPPSCNLGPFGGCQRAGFGRSRRPGQGTTPVHEFMHWASSPPYKIDSRSPKAAVLNLWVATPLAVKRLFHRGCLRPSENTYIITYYFCVNH
uniref:Uncharacterized protein n=1 Tax=Myotis myotis TaxID=51298 RepID=A0A7J7ZZ37_MYOMY|nr:hypothetical protein mMyoMyo1_009975 [Myotis myotis]